VSSLKNKTLFITGSSRGIGLAIALRAAREGANVVVIGKTTEPHARLPGTIYTAAEEIEQAGGHALPIALDIRFEDAVKAAVEQAVQRFGGIDILVNNASAISLTSTAQTSIKRLDLMLGVNLRGTFVCSQACLPYLAQAANPHILTLSPPLDLNPKWFAPHVAYTIAKYGMSLCVLGMAEEFRPQGIAVNALWPRTTIATAALQMIPGAEPERGRTPEIVADAAALIFDRPSRTCTGNFFTDEQVLTAAGVTSFDQYAVSPGQPLQMDFFLD
jgi:citronellol/citronellal dehydrogenase